jgi:hypothetical protein
VSVLFACGCAGSPLALRAHAPVGSPVVGSSLAPTAIAFHGATPLVPGSPSASLASPAATTLPAAVPAAIGTPDTVGALVVANNGGSLSGQVLCPASLISENGGSVVSNNGGTVIANNGGSVIANNGGSLVATQAVGLIGNLASRYRTLATGTQVAVKGVVVTLLDAAGKPVLDDQGRPLTTTTDARGHYAFTGTLPAHNLIVAIQLGAGHGALQAMAPTVGGASRNADVDLISTLTMAYIQSQYVAGQADPISTLDRLSPDVLSATLAKANSAFASSGAAVPSALVREQEVPSVNALRRQDATFDQQMDVVRKLLLIGGQADQGNGRLAADVDFKAHALLVAADGTLYLEDGRRVWHIRADGHIEAIGGGGTSATESIDGKNALTAGFAESFALAQDAQGRILVLQRLQQANSRPNLVRIEPDGTTSELLTKAQTVVGVASGLDGNVYALSGPGQAGEPPALWQIAPDKSTTKVATYSGLDADVITHVLDLGIDASGTANLLVGPGRPDDDSAKEGVKLYHLDAKSHALSLAQTLPKCTPIMDARGNTLFVNDAGGGFEKVGPDGTITPIASQYPMGGRMTGASFTADGTAYAALDDSAVVLKLTGAVAPIVAGTWPGKTTGKLTDIPIECYGLTLGPAGRLYASDFIHRRVLAANLVDSTFTVVAGKSPMAPFMPTSTRATDLDIGYPSVVRFDPDGNMYVAEGNSILVVSVDGNGRNFYTSQDPIFDFIVTPDRGMLISNPGKLSYVSSDQLTTTPIAYPAGIQDRPHYFMHLAPDPTSAGTVIVDVGPPCTWTLRDGLKVLPVETPTKVEDCWGMTVDAKGRVWLAGQNTNLLSRYNPVTGVVTQIAGPGTALLGGNKLDDSLFDPAGLAFDASGNLYVGDARNRQIKLIHAGQLPP